MILRTKGPEHLPAGYEIVLYISMSDSDKVGVFYVESECPPPTLQWLLPLGERASPSQAPQGPPSHHRGRWLERSRTGLLVMDQPSSRATSAL